MGFNKTAVVTDPYWDPAGGRIKVKMDDDGSTKSYLNNELRTILDKRHRLMEKLRRASLVGMMADQSDSTMALPMSPAFFEPIPEEEKNEENSTAAPDTNATIAATAAALATDANAGADFNANAEDEASIDACVKPHQEKPDLLHARISNSPGLFKRRALGRSSTPHSTPIESAENPKHSAKLKQFGSIRGNLASDLGGSSSLPAISTEDKPTRSRSPSPTKGKGKSRDKEELQAMQNQIQQLVASQSRLEKLSHTHAAQQDMLSNKLQGVLETLLKNNGQGTLPPLQQAPLGLGPR